MDQHALAVQQFGSTAARYLASPVHSSGADLDRLAGLARESRFSSALDLGCGAGHASYALARGGANRVVAYDLSEQMLEVAAAEAKERGYTTTIFDPAVSDAAHTLAAAPSGPAIVATRARAPAPAPS